jgi:acid stress-induced BolA-like protein IbaG/YrbA
VDLREIIIRALLKHLKAEYVRLEDEDGVSGFVVSARFKDMPALDRQTLIDKVLRKALTTEEVHRVLMIAAFTREEYETVGARIRVEKVKEKPGGGLEILLYGVQSDAEYVRGAFSTEKGIQTTDPRPAPGAVGVLMSFQARGTDTNPLTKEKALQILKKTRYIEVMPNA